MPYEVLFDREDPNYPEWLKKDKALNTERRNWNRLATIALHDLYVESGVFMQMTNGQRRKINRRRELAEHPELPLTKRELREKNRQYHDGFRPAELPLLVLAGGIAGLYKGIESYGNSALPGNKKATALVDRIDGRLRIDESLRYDGSSVNASALMPLHRVGLEALKTSTEPKSFIINARELLEAANEAARQDGTDEYLEKARFLSIFTETAPMALSHDAQRRIAARSFMESSLLADVKLSLTHLERKVDFLPDGASTFRIEASTPYAHLYVDEDLGNYYEDFSRETHVLADDFLEDDPLRALLITSQVL